MAFGSTVKGGMSRPTAGYRGSAKSNWIRANSDTKTVNTDALRDIFTSTSYTSVEPVEVPENAVRMRARLVFPDGTSDFTSTDPVVRFVGEDANGITERLDNGGDADGAGVTMTIASATDYMLAEDDRLIGNPIDAVGYDVLGMTKVYVLIETASSYTDGSTSQQGEVHIQFLD